MTRLLLAALVAAALPPPVELPRTVAERRTFLADRPREEVAEAVRALSQAALLEVGRRSLPELGTYSARMRKQERVQGRLLEPQVLAITVRERPFAVRMEVLEGPKKGRKVLYNEELRKDEFRVREGGLLGIAALWLSLDSGLARKDTNHPVTDLGFASVMRHLGRDLDRATAHGGHQRRDEGFNRQGHWCLTFTAPAAARDLYAQRTRMCLDLALGLPVELEVRDRDGLLERVGFSDVQAQRKLPANFFTPEAAGL